MRRSTAFRDGYDRALAARMANSFRYFMAPGLGEQGLVVELRSQCAAPEDLTDDPIEPQELVWTT